MKINVIGCIFVLDEDQTNNIRKNASRKLRVVLDKEDLVNVSYDGKTEIKSLLKEKISKVLGTDVYHLEQVYTLGDPEYTGNAVNIFYVAITNKKNINLCDSAKLYDFNVIDNKQILFDNTLYNYETKEIKKNKNAEYIHIIDTKDKKLETNLLTLLICFKHIRYRITDTDILFKFLPNKFTLEEAHKLYEMITSKTVDKSNFRKKIASYCVETEEVKNNKGYRPAKYYMFKIKENDKWI